VFEVLPVKLEYFCDYVRTQSFLGDLAIIYDTVRAVIMR
jgi:lipopolysaccharide/colanic/teichoic acid biosynthesis glycosyltransferase